MRYRLHECRRFRVAEREVLFLVPSHSIFILDELAAEIVRLVEEREALSISDILRHLDGHRSSVESMDTIRELVSLGILQPVAPPINLLPHPVPPAALPLRTLVLNVTNTCNLSCGYCYEYGEDRLSHSPPRAMSWEVARRAVDFLFEHSGQSDRVSLTFFGGEPLLNFKLIRQTVDYAEQRATELGKHIDFSLTTNATLLTRQVIDFLAEHRIGVTVSIDGPRELNDRLRVFPSGRGSYDVIAPKIADLLRRHTTRPIGARVTLTSAVREVERIFDYLIDLGFHDVGFAPVTTAVGRDYALSEEALAEVLQQFEILTERFVEAALRGSYLGFSNLSDLLWELHHGFSKSYPCGAGLGLLGVSPTGDLALCHRFIESPQHRLGTVETGVDGRRRTAFLQAAHLSRKTDCHTCWVRGLCSGGCHHEAYVRYGDTFHPNLHYCDWIRAWTEIGLRAYVRIMEGNPAFFDRLEGRKSP